MTEEWWQQYQRSKPTFRVRLRVTPTAEGGRRSPVFNDYRPSWDIGGLFDGKPVLNDAALRIEGAEQIPPGEAGVVRLHPLAPESWTHVVAGLKLTMQEGARIVGRGEVLERVEATDA